MIESDLNDAKDNSENRDTDGELKTNVTTFDKDGISSPGLLLEICC